MTTQIGNFPVLAERLLSRKTHKWIAGGIGAFLASLCISISAQFSIPFYPVPFTLQTLTVLLAGIILGPRAGGVAIGLYLLEGAAGLPVFASGNSGLAYMMGPTGGYLLGFLPAAVLVGWLARKGWDRNIVSAFAAMLAGNAVIYVPGILWLGSVIGWDKPVLQFGLGLFVISDLLKIAVASLALPFVWRALR